MSDPVTNVDVEDVLSSIRRLVSDTNTDLRPAPKRKVEEAPVAEVRPADALLLTSALRVKAVDDVANTEMPNLRNTLGEGKDATADRARRLHFEDVEQSRLKAEATKDWPPASTDDYYEDDEATSPPPVIDFVRRDRNSTEGSADQAEQEGEVASAAETTPEVAEDTDAEADGDQLEEEEDFSWPETHPTSVSSDDAEMDEAAEAEGNAREDDAGEDDADENEEEIVDWDDAEPSGDESHDPEPVQDGHTDDEEHEDEPNAEMIEETIFASAAAASVIDDGAQSSKPHVKDVDLGDFDESIIDEDALRDLVAEIVRQELTGELGERITRNVRKLVRREIHRALMTREFE